MINESTLILIIVLMFASGVFVGYFWRALSDRSSTKPGGMHDKDIHSS